ncbi:hypothetical protein INT44_009027 [Umbelopsis vinacea]|uniref:BTB domain-containing protein n=1 Tax=Umbelopsis vinacea TaxID=44442 RepID=A0A8H7Q1E6_9FUNG|nr:hypothetical protein INT44_009027 [Umbelopsis vinacea]KAI9286123.1 hypothetical protein BC943DRAFT_322588 [Umbelopsis sp. AD052]
MPGLQSIADLTTQIRTTTGDIPPPLVGASSTVVNDSLYVFAGRTVSSRRMTNDLYVLDLKTYVWSRFIPPPDSEPAPKPRYFHSASVYEGKIIFFGGMGYSRTSSEGLCALDDVCWLDTTEMEWHYVESLPTLFNARPRYAHLSTISGNRLIIVGGQDLNNQYISEINVFDLETLQWVQVCPFDRQCGAYRSVSVSASSGCSVPLFGSRSWDQEMQTEVEGNPNLQRRQSILNKDDVLFRLSYTTPVTTNTENPVYIYSNYNFTDVKRELQLFCSPNSAPNRVQDHSTSMSGTVLPPGLRFPTGHILGHHMILAGTCLTPTSQMFQLWALNLANLVWTRIDSGAILSSGSWNRGILHENESRFLILGNRDRSLLDDYNHRQVNFDHLAVVDTEAFGIYIPPASTCAPIAQELGLSVLNDPVMADFEILSNDGEMYPVNSLVLSERWPHFRELMEKSLDNIEIQDEELKEKQEQDHRRLATICPTTRTMYFPESHSVTLAFLQFIYTDHLLTSEQHQPHILCQLLLLSDIYNLARLKELATHALHQMLTMSTASQIYETAALTGQIGLQVRALKVMISAKKMMQRGVNPSEFVSRREFNGSSRDDDVPDRSRMSMLDEAMIPSSPLPSGMTRANTVGPVPQQFLPSAHGPPMSPSMSARSPPPTPKASKSSTLTNLVSRNAQNKKIAENKKIAAKQYAAGGSMYFPFRG